MTVPFLLALFYRPTGEANGFRYFGLVSAVVKTRLVIADLARGIAQDFGGGGLREVVAEPPVTEGFGGHLANLYRHFKRLAGVYSCWGKNYQRFIMGRLANCSAKIRASGSRSLPTFSLAMDVSSKI